MPPIRWPSSGSATSRDRVGAPDAGPAVQVRKIRAQEGLQGGHRGCRRGRAPARHDRLADIAAGLRRPDEHPRPRRQGQPPVDRADAGRHSRWARSRSARPARSTPPCSRPPCWRSRDPGSPSGSTNGARTPDGAVAERRKDAMIRCVVIPPARRSASSAAASSAACWRSPPPLGLKCHVFARPDSPPSTWRDGSPARAYADNAALDRFAPMSMWSPTSSRTCRADAAIVRSARTSVLPDPQALAITQDRLSEKPS